MAHCQTANWVQFLEPACAVIQIAFLSGGVTLADTTARASSPFPC